MAGLEAEIIDVIDFCRNTLQNALFLPHVALKQHACGDRAAIAVAADVLWIVAVQSYSFTARRCSEDVKLGEAKFVAFVLYRRLPTDLWTPSVLACDTVYMVNPYRRCK